MLLYRALRAGLKWALDLYYVDIQSLGEERVPEEGPLIVAANHPNSIMDTVVLGSRTDREIHYMARSGLFENPAVAALLRRCGVIPIYRRQDQPAGAVDNRDAFEAAYQVLEAGGALGIFPEGTNAPERQVRELKTGTARIALAAEARNGFSLGVRIVPVGLSYQDRDRFHSRVLVRFGAPIDAREFAEAYARDPREAARELTDRVQEALRGEAVHIHDLRHERLVKSIEAIYGEIVLEERLGALPDLRGSGRRLLDRAALRSGRRVDLDGRFTVTQWIADAIAHYEAHEPETLARVRRAVDRHEDHLAQVRMRHDFAARPAHTLSSRKEALKLTLYALLLAPLALWGFAHNVVPYRLTRWLSSRAPDEAMRAITAFLGGAVIYGLVYAAYGIALLRAGDSPWLVAAYLTSLPITGFWFLRYGRRLLRYRDRILVRTLFRTRRHLHRQLLFEREQLHITLGELRRFYEDHVARERERAAGLEPGDAMPARAPAPDA